VRDSVLLWLSTLPVSQRSLESLRTLFCLHHPLFRLPVIIVNYESVESQHTVRGRLGLSDVSWESGLVSHAAILTSTTGCAQAKPGRAAQLASQAFPERAASWGFQSYVSFSAPTVLSMLPRTLHAPGHDSDALYAQCSQLSRCCGFQS